LIRERGEGLARGDDFIAAAAMEKNGSRGQQSSGKNESQL
jgi:hypothetical protein